MKPYNIMSSLERRKSLWHHHRASWLLVKTVLWLLPPVLGSCPSETDLLRRIGTTRFYIVHKNERGNFVGFQDAFGKCSEYGLEVAKIKNMRTLAMVGRELEQIVDANGLKDTWYWLDAKFNSRRDVYEWGQEGTDGDVQFSNFFYRAPRPTGVAGFVDYKGQYHSNHEVDQCLTLALPWPGKVEQSSEGLIFGHHTMLDERPCESVQRRHVICESKDAKCNTNAKDPFLLTEDKVDYFENGNWIFGERKFLVNWKHRTINESQAYCKSLGLELFKPNKNESGLIPYLKMWSRHVTTSQFWTSYSYNSLDKSFLDSAKNLVAEGDSWKHKFDETLQARSSKLDTDYCVAMVVSYEFKGQLPCKDHGNPNCTWSFVEYVPTNCNNYLATICQHSDKDSRASLWMPSYVQDVDVGLKATALTKDFGVVGNKNVLRSKYKQTFGNLYCPKEYRMLRASNLNWTTSTGGAAGAKKYLYDYMEIYWVVDEGLFDKKIDSLCTVSCPSSQEGTVRQLTKVNCTEWHFYACEKITRKTRMYDLFTIPKAPKMQWKEGPQPRLYPLIKRSLLARSGIQSPFSKDYVPSERYHRFILTTVNKTKKAFTLGRFPS